MVNPASFSRVGVYVDASNIYRNGGNRMRYDVLREFAVRDGAELMRLNAYVSYDAERARVDSAYDTSVNKFFSVIRDLGYKVIIKEVKWYEDEAGDRYGKANADLDLAVDVLLQSEKLERVVLVSGDGDFTRVVRAVQNRGCRVEVIGLDNVSTALRCEADIFVSGYIIPNLVPTAGNGSWGALGSRVRGVCYAHRQDFGFMRYLSSIAPDIWMTDTRRAESPYEAVYFRDPNLPETVDPNMLPSYHHVFEFELGPSDHRKGRYEAVNIELISRISG
jgi:uncharacterized LabA/DUF88 family protein